MVLGRRFQGAGIAFYIDVENEREKNWQRFLNEVKIFGEERRKGR